MPESTRRQRLFGNDQVSGSCNFFVTVGQVPGGLPGRLTRREVALKSLRRPVRNSTRARPYGYRSSLRRKPFLSASDRQRNWSMHRAEDLTVHGQFLYRPCAGNVGAAGGPLGGFQSSFGDVGVGPCTEVTQQDPARPERPCQPVLRSSQRRTGERLYVAAKLCAFPIDCKQKIQALCHKFLRALSA